MTKHLKIATLVALVAWTMQLASCNKGDDGNGGGETETNYFELTGVKYDAASAFADEFPNGTSTTLNCSIYLYSGSIMFPAPTPPTGEGPILRIGIEVPISKADAEDISGTYTTTLYCDGYASKDYSNNALSSDRIELLDATIMLAKVPGSSDNYQIKITYTEDGKAAKAYYKGKMTVRR